MTPRVVLLSPDAAWREPIVFLGGVFAGALALSLEQGAGGGPAHLVTLLLLLRLPSPWTCSLAAEPLRSWVQETAAEAGLLRAGGDGGSSSSSGSGTGALLRNEWGEDDNSSDEQ